MSRKFKKICLRNKLCWLVNCWYCWSQVAVVKKFLGLWRNLHVSCYKRRHSMMIIFCYVLLGFCGIILQSLSWNSC